MYLNCKCTKIPLLLHQSFYAVMYTAGQIRVILLCFMSELTKISVMFGNFGRNKKSFSRVSVCPLNIKWISYIKNCIFYMDNDGFAGNGSFDEKSFSFSHTYELKFIYSEKAKNFCEIFPLLLTTVHTVKSKVKIFVALSEYMNFTKLDRFLP